MCVWRAVALHARALPSMCALPRAVSRICSHLPRQTRAFIRVSSRVCSQMLLSYEAADGGSPGENNTSTRQTSQKRGACLCF